MRTLIIVLLSLTCVLAACTPRASDAASQDTEVQQQLNDIWALERVGIEDIDAAELPEGIELPTIEFQLAENRVGGTDGCNNFSGELSKVNNETLTFGPLASTRKACQGSRLPDRVGSALNKVSAYRIDGLTLSLLNSDGAEILRYRKVD